MIGIDIIEIDRIKSALNDNSGERFLERVYTPNEISYCKLKNSYKYNSLAARFAAKEAVAKALGTGLKQFVWTDIEITNNDEGKPSVNLFNGAKNKAENMNIKEIHISLSHSKTLAFASAHIEYK